MTNIILLCVLDSHSGAVEQPHVQPQLNQAASPSQTLSQNIPELWRNPQGSSSPTLSKRKCRVWVVLEASSAGQLCCTQRKLQHALHSPETTPLLCMCSKRFPRQELLPVLLLLSSVRWVRSSTESLHLIPLWQKKSCKMYRLSIMGRKCKRKEICEWEKASVSSLADSEVMSNLLRSLFYKSEDLCVVSLSMSANTFCVWAHCLQSKHHLQQCLFHQASYFQHKISYSLVSLNTVFCTLWYKPWVCSRG